MIDKIHNIVLSDRRIKVREILHEKLGVKKILASWVPRLLSEKNKRNRMVDWGYFDAFPSQSWWVSASIHNCGRNMDTPLHSRDKGIVKIVDFWRRTVFEKGEDCDFGRQGNGCGFLGCTWNHQQRLLEKWTNDKWSVLCVVSAPVKRRHQEKTSLFEKDPLPSRQCTVHVRIDRRPMVGPTLLK